MMVSVSDCYVRMWYVVAILLSQNTQIVNELVHGYGFPALLYDLRVIAFHSVGDHSVHENYFLWRADKRPNFGLCALQKKKCGVHLAK